MYLTNADVRRNQILRYMKGFSCCNKLIIRYWIITGEEHLEILHVQQYYKLYMNNLMKSDTWEKESLSQSRIILLFVETSVILTCARKPARFSVIGKINLLYDGVIICSYFKSHFNIFLAFVIGTKVVKVVLLVAVLRYDVEGRAFDNRLCHWNFSFT